ncbi:hypothetical protein QFZ23_003648 [Arthrobacter globiformis]|uniref:hypothetical protein n=1 Tax=Arthrobacter globiformis TaxID=1665 RepID=UPI00278A0761|nr:hypothetical protein [Arthrobacter globiformis]MDQ1059747.1 hypothetical protein [Arthrobacter globiformis]
MATSIGKAAKPYENDDATQPCALPFEEEPCSIDWDAVRVRTVAHPKYTECVCAPGVECGWDDALWSDDGTCDVCYEPLNRSGFEDDNGFIGPAEIDPEKFQHNIALVEEYRARFKAYEEWRTKEPRDMGRRF